MKHPLKRTKPRMRYDISGLETRLQAAMRPIAPRSTYVSDLKLRLMSAPDPRSDTLRTLAFTALALMGVISGALLLVSSLRALALVMGGLAALRLRASPAAGVALLKSSPH